MKRIIAREHGGPDVLKIEDVEAGHPGPDQTRVRNQAVGVTYTDMYTRQRSKIY